jgi:hypothetical protein
MIGISSKVQLELILPYFEWLVLRFIASEALIFSEIIFIYFILWYPQFAFYHDKKGKLQAILSLKDTKAWFLFFYIVHVRLFII